MRDIMWDVLFWRATSIMGVGVAKTQTAKIDKAFQRFLERRRKAV